MISQKESKQVSMDSWLLKLRSRGMKKKKRKNKDQPKNNHKKQRKNKK